MEITIGKTRLKVLKGDITAQDTEAVVNAANSRLAGGGGVDGAIHRVGGPEIMRQCDDIRREKGGCPPGDAVITTGGDLPARYVIHTVGPIWNGGLKGEDAVLRRAYLSSLDLARREGLRSLSFPSISTGAYRFPIDRAARIALSTVREYLAANHVFDEVRFVLFNDATLGEYLRAMEELQAD